MTTENYRAYLVTTDEKYIQLAITQCEDLAYRHCLEGSLSEFICNGITDKVGVYKNGKLLRICHMSTKYFEKGDSFRFVFMVT